MRSLHGTVVGRAFADLWRRSSEGMPLRWRHRPAEHWRRYRQGYVTEAEHRRRGAVPTVEEHLRLRGRRSAPIGRWTWPNRSATSRFRNQPTWNGC
ncbi:terpene synthase family protein [Kitasatospora sp. NPDC059811]|uniref:terpene synthase family protein n=1 Tax=unclassified Kitasatospora TaxID=2633591 RepID=UPI003652BAA1